MAVVYAGEIVEYGSKREIFKNPSHPYTAGLFGSLPDVNADTERLSPIAGMPPDPSNLPQGCAFAPRCERATDACRKGTVPMIEVEPGHTCCCCNLKQEE